ncbi:hypothetical protein CRG98_046687 [Punica granatum]|uniref:Methyltransferase n=1 Tax=Punica granatum TaxID=22663 RepID=A0A2I0HMW1_PUNGR|nr:hypothetical protein CRG98_046687 [Punica granatum]
MNAQLGGFAAALVEDPVWVVNVVPVEARLNTLRVVYERGLVGTYQSWYNSHLFLFKTVKKRCLFSNRYIIINGACFAGAKQCLLIQGRKTSSMLVQYLELVMPASLIIYGGCEMEDIMLEMDSILRPEGSVIIRDGVDVLVKVKSIIDWMNYDSQIINHEDGPLVREKLLFAVKSCWTAPAPLDFIHHVSTNSNLAHAS